MSRLADFSQRLHHGESSYDFVGRWRRWVVISLILMLVSIGSLAIRQLNFGVEFSGGSVFTFSSEKVTKDELETTVHDVVAKANPENNEVVVQEITGNQWRVQTPSLSADAVTEVQNAIGKKTGINPDNISQDQIGPTWGLQVSQKAGIGLGIFLLACIIFLWAVFEAKMAIAAIVALFHDLLFTAGIYSLVGFEVTPATVIGFLTILGYSLYDTVVVFDKVRENTVGILGGSRTTYSRAANLGVNQTLARSINTSVVALLPVVGILIVSTFVINAGQLQDLALALFAGMLAGTYSSIFIATPLLALMKEREPRMVSLRRRVEAREAAQSGEKRKKKSSAKKAKPETSASSDQDADEDEGPDDAAERDLGGKIEAKTTGGSTVTVTTGKSGGGASAVKRTSGSGQAAAKRGSQRPQPKRGGTSNKRKSSKGKKKR